MHNRMWCKGSHLRMKQRVADLKKALDIYDIELSTDGDIKLPTVWLQDSPNLEEIPQTSNPLVPNILILDYQDSVIPNPEWFQYFSDVLIWRSADQVAEKILSRFKRVHSVQARIEQSDMRDLLTGCSTAWQKALYDLTEAAIFSESPILITGENGTGKELAARWIHRVAQTNRQAHNSLTTVDCTQFSKELMGSELFGHVKGAFTGAIQHRSGAIEQANGGFLFLDEVGEIPIDQQSALLRVLQEGSYKPVGSSEWKKAQFRLISATNRNLKQEQDEHRFRTDLYYRINGWHCHLPSLKERVSDIVPLAINFLCQQTGKLVTLDEWVRSYLVGRPYPGNIRELKHLCGRIANRYSGAGDISLMDLPLQDLESGTYLQGVDHTLNEVVSVAIQSGVDLKHLQQKLTDCAKTIAIDQTGGNLQQAAKLLGIHERTLQLHQAKCNKGAPSLG